MTEHTQGPWRMHSFGGANTPTVIYAGEGIRPTLLKGGSGLNMHGNKYLGEVAVHDGADYREESANAHLIVAAPDLLAFCEAIHERYNVDDRMGGLGDWLADVITKAHGVEVDSAMMARDRAGQ